MKKQIQTPNAPAPTGTYSQALVVGNTVYLSGQTGFDPATNEIERGIAPETRQVLKNMESLLSACGCGLKDIVKITSYLEDVEEFATVNAIFRELMPEPYPARTTVQVHLRRGIRIEMDAIAVIPDPQEN